MLKASQYSLKQGHPLVTKNEGLTYPKTHEKSLIEFKFGDPSAFGHNNISIPDEGLEIMKESILDSANHGYTPSTGLIQAREAISKAYSIDNYKLQMDDIYLSNGGLVAMYFAVNAMCNPGDNILVPAVGYPYYQGLAEAEKFNIRYYHMDEKKDFEINLQDLESKIDEKTRFVYFVNPSNPLGTVYSKQHLLDFLKVCEKKQVPVVSDEIYWNMSFDDADFISLGHLTTSVPVIVMTGFDKNFVCPGYTLCFLLTFDPAKALNEVKQGILAINQLFLHPPTFIQKAIPGLMEKVTPNYLKSQMMTFNESRQFLYTSIQKIKGLKPFYPKGTFFLSIILDLTCFKDINSDKDFVQKLLLDQNVSAMTISSFCNEQVLHGLRIFTFASQEINKDLVDRLEQFCKKHYK